MDAQLSRRSFLGLAAGAVTAAGAGVVLARPPRARTGRPSVVVVGAGLAGLTAAYELERSGLRATVVEARGRVGGRVYTVREGFEGGQHAEAGGEYIDSVHTHLRAYCRRFGLPLENVRRGFAGLRDLVLYEGQVLRNGRFFTRRVSQDVGEFYREVYRLGSEIDPADPVATGGELDALDVGSVLDELDLSQRGRFVIESYLRDDYGAEPGDLSLLYLAAEERLYRNVGGGEIENARIRGGNDLLARAFAERLRELRLEAPVTEVAHDDAGVEVSAGGAAVGADFAVLAAPLPALAQVTFSPPLAGPLAAAIPGLSYGRVTKNLVQCRRRVWRRQGASGDLVTDLPLGTTWEATDQQQGRRGILIDYAAAGASAHFEPLTDPERQAYTGPALDQVFPGFAQASDGFRSVSWPIEPFTGGCWIAPRPGEMSDHWAALREPVGRLHLAGEHTAVFSGYMEGAIRSGRRVAREIAERAF